MALPPTYYDFVRKLRPSLVEMAEQDAADLLSGPNPPQAIHRRCRHEIANQRVRQRICTAATKEAKFFA